MPRLDWRLWFAPLGPVQRSPWLFRVEELLLRGSPDVVGLFAGDPFDGRPPRFVRALSYRYRFTTPEERRLTSHWWTRELLGPFGPATTLAPDGRVVPAGRPR
jgi:hypothetical protein